MDGLFTSLLEWLRYSTYIQQNRSTRYKTRLGWIHGYFYCGNSVWSPFCAAAGASSYLLLDEFSIHMKPECVRALKAGHGSEVDFIPGRYIRALQC